MRHGRSLSILVAVIVLACVPSNCRAELLLNGGFDDTTATFNNWTYSGNVYNQGNEGTTNNSALAAVFNPGDTAGDGKLSQTFATVAGTAYYLTFDYGAYGGSDPQLLEAKLTDSTSGDVLQDQTVTASGTGQTVFTSYFLGFTAENTSTTLTFSDLSSVSSPVFPSDGVLDSASVNPVPEPSSLVLVGIAGLVGSVYTWRRQAKRAR